MAKLDKPARIGCTVFGVGVDYETVIKRAQREFEFARLNRDISKNIKDLPPEFSKAIDDNFFDLT